MGRQDISKEDASSVVVQSSSIALLQERFRQLQRVKEMREEREVVKLLSLSNPQKPHSDNHYYYYSFFNNNNNNNNYDSNGCVLFEPTVARFFSHPELMMLLPTTPTTTTATTTLMVPQTSLSLWPTSPSPSQPKKLVPPLMNLWPPADTINTAFSSCDRSATALIDQLHHHHHHHHSVSHADDIDTSLHL